MIGSIGRLSGYCRNTLIDSGYIFCVIVWLLNVISHIFYVEVDSNPEVFFLHSLAEWRSMLSLCSSFFGPRRDARTWKTGHFFYELHVAETSEMDSIFREALRNRVAN